jgi:hypothetical protein
MGQKMLRIARTLRAAATMLVILIAGLTDARPAISQTAEAVCVYQQRLYVGTETHCNSISRDVILRNASSPTKEEVTRFVQFGLNAMGYDAGTVDGLMGAQTRTAIQRFNNASGLTGSNISEEFLKAFQKALVANGHLKRLETLAADNRQRDQTTERRTDEERRFNISQEAWILGACWGFAGAWMFAMFLYPSWYVNLGKPGDTIGAAYANGKLPMRCFLGFVFATSAAFASCPWPVALAALVGQPIAAAILLTVLRSHVQMFGFIGALAGVVAAVSLIVSLGRPLPL